MVYSFVMYTAVGCKGSKVTVQSQSREARELVFGDKLQENLQSLCLWSPGSTSSFCKGCHGAPKVLVSVSPLFGGVSS